MIFNGIIKDKVLNIRGLADWTKTQKDGKFNIEIKRFRRNRSLQQNALYWSWLTIISIDTGYDKEELHTTFRSMFLTDRRQKLPLIRSTTALNKIQFGQYLNKVERVASELGIELPHPEEY